MVGLRPLTLPTFQGSPSPKVMVPALGATTNAFLRTFDFSQFGHSAIRQNLLNYAIVISSRMVAAFVRARKTIETQGTGSYNEVKEHARRDVLGLIFWFFASEKVERLFIRTFPTKYREALLLSIKPQATEAATQGFFGRLKQALKREYHFFFKGSIITNHQIQELTTQLKSALPKDSKELATAENFFKKLRDTRGIVSFLGIIFGIALLGIGIPRINIMLTKKDVARRRQEALNAIAGAQNPTAPLAPKQAWPLPQQPMPLPMGPTVPYYPNNMTGYSVPMPAGNPFSRSPLSSRY